MGFIVLVVIRCCAYCISKLFPEGVQFIRLPDEDEDTFDGVEDIEARIQGEADAIKVYGIIHAIVSSIGLYF